MSGRDKGSDQRVPSLKPELSTNSVVDGVPCRSNASNVSLLRGAHIIIVFEQLELGGAERQGLLLARYLKRAHAANVEVWGFSHPTGPVAKLCEEYCIPSRIVPLEWRASSARIDKLRGLVDFARALRRAKVDVVLPYTMLPNIVCGIVWRWAGVRSCIWSQRDEGLGRVGKRAEAIAVRQTPWFISNSQHGADFLVKELGARENRVNVIRNGVILATPLEDRSAWRRRLGLTEDVFVACMVANLHHYKDHQTLLKAWHLVLNQLEFQNQSAILLLAGRFDDTPQSLKALAFDLGLCRRVRFLGHVSDISGLLGAVDLGVFSSQFEGCPNGIVEQMAVGLSIAATDIPGIREAVGPDGHAFLAEPGDAAMLADRILQLASDGSLRARIGASNRKRVSTLFDPALMCELTTRVIVDSLHYRDAPVALMR